MYLSQESEKIKEDRGRYYSSKSRGCFIPRWMWISRSTAAFMNYKRAVAGLCLFQISQVFSLWLTLIWNISQRNCLVDIPQILTVGEGRGAREDKTESNQEQMRQRHWALQTPTPQRACFENHITTFHRTSPYLLPDLRDPRQLCSTKQRWQPWVFSSVNAFPWLCI